MIIVYQTDGRIQRYVSAQNAHTRQGELSVERLVKKTHAKAQFATGTWHRWEKDMEENEVKG